MTENAIVLADRSDSIKALLLGGQGTTADTLCVGSRFGKLV
jgi:hypothetical protein